MKSFYRARSGFFVFVLFFSGAVFSLEKNSIYLVPKVASAPADNPITDEKIELGRKLFFDKRLSSTKTISCNTCHNIISDKGKPASGTDNLSLSVGVFGSHGNRNTPTVWNTGLRTSFFWDGRAISLEEQAKGPIMNPVEMGMMNAEIVEKAVRDVPEYRILFKKIFSNSNSKEHYKISIDDIAKVIATFERTLVTPDSAFDRFQQGDKNAMSKSAQRGWDKFKAHACIACHAAPTFDNKDFFVRFPMHEVKDYNSRYQLSEDVGRFNATHEYKDRHLWRIPSLQNVAVTGPYFHNGSVADLDEAVRIMAKAQLGKVLPEEDVKDIVEFLKSLTGQFPEKKNK
jgi:cytochrome c peroxidase